MYKFKVNDTIQVMSGKDKDRSGKVLIVNPKEHTVLVENINLYKKHIKAKGNEPGQVLSLPRALPTANVALVCPSCGKPTRVGFDASVKPKVRVCHLCRQIINHQSKK